MLLEHLGQTERPERKSTETRPGSYSHTQTLVAALRDAGAVHRIRRPHG